MERARHSVSAVVCAYTEARWTDLVRAVDSLLRQSPAPDEVLVVIDHNDALLDRARTQLVGTRVLPSDGEPGLSGARNTGVAAATGDIVAFLDDDAAARPGWLAGMLARFEDPATLGVAGQVLPVWPGRRPGWFPAEFDWVVGCSYAGLPEAPAAVRNPIGSSMAFRRDVMLSVDGFRHGIGRTGAIPLGGEETEFSIRLSRRYPHRVVLYDPTIVADHWVSANRTGWAYFRSRCWSEGVSKAAIRTLVGAGDGLSAERDYLGKVLPRAVLAGLRRPGTGWLRAGTVIAGVGFTTAGYLAGAWRYRRGRAIVATPRPVVADDGP